MTTSRWADAILPTSPSLQSLATVPAPVEIKLDAQVRFNCYPDKVVLFDGGSGVSLQHAG